MAAEAGLAAAQFNLAVILHADANEGDSLDQVRFWMGKAAEQGHAEAKKELGKLRGKAK